MGIVLTNLGMEIDEKHRKKNTVLVEDSFVIYQLSQSDCIVALVSESTMPSSSVASSIHHC